MQDQSSSSGRERSLPNRRTFLIASGLGATGLLLFSPDRAVASPIFGAVEIFARAIDAAPVASDISTYVRRNEIAKHTALEVERLNCTTIQNGFSDFANSAVYVPKSEKTYFFYPVRHSDRFNAIGQFFDRKLRPDGQFVISLSGPALFGIAELATSIARQHPEVTASAALLPRQTVQTGEMSMERSSSRPDIYRTDDGNVRISYVTNGNERGTVTVEARDRRGKLLAGGDYELTYRD